MKSHSSHFIGKLIPDFPDFKSQERGVSLIIFAVLLVAVMIAVAMVIDSVIATTTQRQLVVASEEAALTAAQRLTTASAEVQRSVLVQGSSAEISYRNLLIDVEQAANQVQSLNRIIGTTGENQPLGHLKLKLRDCKKNKPNDAWCSGSLADGGILEPGTWYRKEDGPPPPSQGIPGCKLDKHLPCFVPLSKNDVPIGESVPDLGANAFRVRTALRNPLLHFFAKVFGQETWQLGGEAIAWIAPLNAMFLVDLSPTIHGDTHLRRTHPDPDTGEMKRGVKTEFAFRDEDTEIDCESFCPETLYDDKFFGHITSTSQITLAITAIQMLKSFFPDNTVLDWGCDHNEMDVRICPVFGPGTYNVCVSNYCDYHDLDLSVCDYSDPTSHCRVDYQDVAVAVSDFSEPSPDTRTFKVDVSTHPDSSLVRGAEPLFSILGGIHYAAKLLERRAKGDQIGLLGFDWELFGDDAHNISRVFLLGKDYQTVTESTKTDVTQTEALDTSKNNPYTRLLFSRGLYYANNEVYPVADLSDITDLQPALQKSFSLLDNAHTPSSREFVMLFTDGRPNCVGDHTNTSLEPPDRCVDSSFHWHGALQELYDPNQDGSILHFINKEIPIHVVLYDVEVGAHTLNLTTNSEPTTECMSDRTARLSHVPFVIDDCFKRDLYDTLHEVFDTAHDIYGQRPDLCTNFHPGEPFFSTMYGFGGLLDIFGFLMDLDDFVNCCFNEENGIACAIGILTPFACPNACCALYNATTKMGASRVYESNIFYGPNMAFYAMAAQTRGLWAPLREYDPFYPVGIPTDNASDGTPRLCSRVYPGAADPFNNTPPQRQLYDPWGRTKQTQVLDAVEVVMNESPIMLVK